VWNSNPHEKRAYAIANKVLQHTPHGTQGRLAGPLDARPYMRCRYHYNAGRTETLLRPHRGSVSGTLGLCPAVVVTHGARHAVAVGNLLGPETTLWAWLHRHPLAMRCLLLEGPWAGVHRGEALQRVPPSSHQLPFLKLGYPFALLFSGERFRFDCGMLNKVQQVHAVQLDTRRGVQPDGGVGPHSTALQVHRVNVSSAVNDEVVPLEATASGKGGLDILLNIA